MNKQLDQLNIEELGNLFPIVIAEPNPDWIKMFAAEKINIVAVLGARNIARIEHIGSTAIQNLKSKPTIDILVEVPESIDTKMIIRKLKSMDYHYIHRPENPAPHMMFVKGYTEGGFKGQAYHIHVRYPGDWDELYFRDYLKLHPEIAREYGELKANLAVEYKNDREAYTEKKTDFIKRITEIATQARK
jgi:GrpB-like predicted nucleotidyltransferase (UPF0157 family)